MGIGGSFRRGKVWPGREADHSPHLVPMSWMSRIYTSYPPIASMACNGAAFLFYNKYDDYLLTDVYLLMTVCSWNRYCESGIICLCSGCLLKCYSKVASRFIATAKALHYTPQRRFGGEEV
jgi:hypothetical protein